MTDSDFNITGAETELNPPPVRSSLTNIVLLTDGTCGSTCTLFAYLMILEKNVRTTNVGGRPKTGKMQSIAGVEGAQVFYMNEMSEIAQPRLSCSIPLPMSRTASCSSWTKATPCSARPTRRAPAPSMARRLLPVYYSRDAAAVRVQAAKCRFFYTKEMIQGRRRAWKRTVDATWTDPQK